jgi:hypothetical protein
MQPPADGDSEFFCMHEPDVPLLNRDFERNTWPAILSGDGDGQLQVLLDEPTAGLTVAGSGRAAKLFNEKEVRTGLRDVVIAFGGGSSFERKMLDRSTWSPSKYRPTMETLEVVNLPSREWVTLSPMGELPPKDADKLKECNRARLRGSFPDGRRFNERVPFAK